MMINERTGQSPARSFILINSLCARGLIVNKKISNDAQKGIKIPGGHEGHPAVCIKAWMDPWPGPKYGRKRP